MKNCRVLFFKYPLAVLADKFHVAWATIITVSKHFRYLVLWSNVRLGALFASWLHQTAALWSTPCNVESSGRRDNCRNSAVQMLCRSQLDCRQLQSSCDSYGSPAIRTIGPWLHLTPTHPWYARTSSATRAAALSSSSAMHSRRTSTRTGPVLLFGSGIRVPVIL